MYSIFIFYSFSEFGHRPTVSSFVDNHIALRRSDGALVSVGISPYVAILHEFSASSSWKEALRLCRMVKVSIEEKASCWLKYIFTRNIVVEKYFFKKLNVSKDDTLWACLAVMATQAKDLETSEAAFAAINQYDKVLYLQHIKVNQLINYNNFGS